MASDPIAALERFVVALNRRGAEGTTEAAVAPTILVERYGFGAREGVLVERLEGLDAVREWLGRTPEGVVFTLDGDPSADAAGGWQARYRLAIGAIHGAGAWRARLAEDGRLGWLEHRPDNIADAVEEGERDHDHGAHGS